MRSTWCGTHQIHRMGFVHWPSRTWQQIWFNQSLYFLHWSLLKCICNATMNTLYQESPTLVWRSWQLCGVPIRKREPNEDWSNSLWNTFEHVDRALESQNELKHPPPKQMPTRLDRRSRWQSFQKRQQRGCERTDLPCGHSSLQLCDSCSNFSVGWGRRQFGGTRDQRSVVNSKPKTKQILDRDKIWSIFLNPEQFHGVCLGD